MNLLCPRHGALVAIDWATVRAYIVNDDISYIIVGFDCSVCGDRVLSETLGSVIGYFPLIQQVPWPHPWRPQADDADPLDNEEFNEQLRLFLEEGESDA